MAQKWYHKAAVQAAIVSGMILIIIALITTLPSLFNIPGLKREIEKLEKELSSIKAERDKYQTQLAPFLATANLKFPDIDPDKRLDFLVQKMDKVIDTVQNATDKIFYQRVIPEYAVNQLINNLKNCTSILKVDINFAVSDQESSKLAAQIKDIFKKAGWNDVRIRQTILSPLKKGIEIKFLEYPSEEIQKALFSLFDGLGYKREINLSEKVDQNTLRIVVYSK